MPDKNILILSCGRRVDIVEFFVKEFHLSGFGKVFAADMNPYAPALYAADESFIIKKDFNNLAGYIDNIIHICLQHNIKYIISLIDPELVLLSNNINRFETNGIFVIVSDKNIVEKTFDKYDFYRSFYRQLSLIPTYTLREEITNAFKTGEMAYPVFKKIRTGSGSAGIGKVYDQKDLDLVIDNPDYIVQPCVLEKEFGVDVYFDFFTGNIVSLFIKEKLAMRSGETDKAVSVFHNDIVEEILKLQNLGFKGPVDVDVFQDKNGKLYINEVNPRFGGGYPHAYAAGVNFVKLLVNNFKGIKNETSIGDYTKGLVMMKYNGLMFKSEKEILV